MPNEEFIASLRQGARARETSLIAVELNYAADLIESMQAKLAEKDAEIKRLNDEPPAYKFYYCESEDSYLLGRRVGNFYYAHWHDGIGFVFDMSRYLPWGEHVVALRTAWKEHTYPSEPKEINSSEWFNGFLAQRLSASHRRERAAAKDIPHICETCGKKGISCLTCNRSRQNDPYMATGDHWRWKGWCKKERRGNDADG